MEDVRVRKENSPGNWCNNVACFDVLGEEKWESAKRNALCLLLALEEESLYRGSYNCVRKNSKLTLLSDNNTDSIR